MNENYLHLLPVIGRLVEPRSYYSGTPPCAYELPTNVILFQRFERDRLMALTSVHHRFVLILNCRGEGSAHLDHRCFDFRPGNILLIFPHQFHHFSHIEEPDPCWLFVTFEHKDVVALELLRDSVLECTQQISRCFGFLLERYGESMPKGGQAGAPIIIATAMLLSELVAHCLRGSVGRPKSGHGGRRVNRIDRINRYIFAHVDSALLLADLAKEFTISESHLRLYYRRNTGISLGRYIREVKINKATGLLLAGDLNVSQIAVCCGYASVQSFSRAFSAATSLAPLAYRHRYCNQ